MVVGRNRRVGNKALRPGFGRNTLRFPAERHTARLNSNDVLPLQTQLSGQMTRHTPGGGGRVSKHGKQTATTADFRAVEGVLD